MRNALLCLGTAALIACDEGRSEQSIQQPVAIVDTQADASVAEQAVESAPDAQVTEVRNEDPADPPKEHDGKVRFGIRFDVRAGQKSLHCAQKTPALGLASTTLQLLDARFFVHDVTLVRASGELVPLALYQDKRFQRDNVALLDFADDQGTCLTGDPTVRDVVFGYAPEADDYVGVQFKLGVPEDKNHLNGADAPPPYNAIGMWWSWTGGYKYLRIDVTSEAQPVWYLHLGANGCQGTTMQGIKCTGENVAEVKLQDFKIATDSIVLDLEKLYAESDLSKSTDSLPGCMTSPTDPECGPLANALGLVLGDDRAARPVQTAFRVEKGGNQPRTSQTPAQAGGTKDPYAWPQSDFMRPAALDKANISTSDSGRSHKPDDPRYGKSCMRCHQEHGPGIGRFSAAGTVVLPDGSPAVGTKVEIVRATGDFVTRTLKDVTVLAELAVDKNGNFYTTETLPYASERLTARLRGADGQILGEMLSTKQTGACNTCHDGRMRLTAH
jgi:uncharacterized repeat protein (TIGR04052 family)